MIISAEAGNWFYDGSSTILTIDESTSWKLIRICEVIVENEDQSVESINSDLNIQIKDGVILVNGLTERTKIDIYDIAGSLIGSTIATNGTAAFNTGLIEGNTVIVKVGNHSMKISIR